MARKRVEDRPSAQEAFNKLKLGEDTIVEALSEFERMLTVINLAVPSRTTARQLQAIVSIMLANAKSERITLTDLRSRELATDPNLNGTTGNVNANLNKSYQAFFSDPRNDNSLGWVEQQPDPNDARVKYLILTHKGADVAEDVATKTAEQIAEENEAQSRADYLASLSPEQLAARKATEEKRAARAQELKAKYGRNTKEG